MRFLLLAAFVGTIAASGCGVRTGCPAMTDTDEKAVAESVRTYMRNVAQDVTHDGVSGWKKHFENNPSFFMAVNGHVQFRDGNAAMQGIDEVARALKSIDLRWGDDLRVDPLTRNLAVVATTWREAMVDAEGHAINESGFFTAVAENREGKWQLRNAHWSAPVPPARIP